MLLEFRLGSILAYLSSLYNQNLINVVFQNTWGVSENLSKGEWIFMVEYRPLNKNEHGLFFQLANYAFTPEKGNSAVQKQEEEVEIYGELKGVFAGDRLVTTYQLLPLECKVRGQWFQLGGIGDVVSPPENRRKGYIGQMLTFSLQEMRERGMLLSALWPFSYPFYRKYGWEAVSAFKQYTLKPDLLQSSDQIRGEFVRLTADNFSQLDKIYQLHHSHYDLELKRDTSWWERIIEQNKKGEKYVYLWEEAGEARGYIIYSIKVVNKGGDDKELLVREMAAADYTAYRQLLRFLYYHDSQVKTITWSAPLNDPLGKILPSPWIDQHQYKAGAMFRIVDVEGIFNGITYPAGPELILYFTINDSIAPWNNGNYRLEVRGGKGRCSKVVSVVTIDFTIDINRLAPVIIGFMTPYEAEQLGYLTTRNGEISEKLQALLPGRDTYFYEFF